MKKIFLIKIRWLVFFSIWAFGLVSSNEQWPIISTDSDALPGDDVVYFNPVNKTDFHGFQPRMGDHVQSSRNQKTNNAKNRKKMTSTSTDHTRGKQVVQTASNGQQSMDIPILIYRGPNRPMEPYRTRSQTKQQSRYIGSASKLVKNQENNRLTNTNKNGKNSRNVQIAATPRSTNGQKSKMKGMYEDISILQQPINTNSKGRKTPPYNIPERQNFDIHSGGMYGDDPEIDISQNLKSELIQPKSDDQYSDSVPKSRNRPNRVKVLRRKLYSRNYDLDMITPPNYDFEVMDHYDGGFSLPKPKRESPHFGNRPRSYYGPGDFGVEFDYDNYDVFDGGYRRSHRSSNVQPEYDSEPVHYESSSGPMARPVSRPNGNRRRSQRPRRRQRQGQAVTTGTDSNTRQITQLEANDRSYTRELRGQSSPRDQESMDLPNRRTSASRTRPAKTESVPNENIEPTDHGNSYATSAAIESTYANVEIRRTSPRRLNRPTSLRPTGNERLRTNRRLSNEQKMAHPNVPQTYNTDYQQQ